jgi:dihydrofolate reductase
MTGRIQIDLFTTLDLIAQAPGGPQEDTEGGFEYGGWQAPYFDEVVGQSIGAGIADLDALLLGRKTYDIWASYWPWHEGPDSAIADQFNSVPKYVASRSDLELSWQGSTRIGSDLVREVEALRERHRNIHVIGSMDFVQTLLRESLFDELALWVYPLVLGKGKPVFGDGVVPATLRLIAPPVTGSTGAVLLRYAPGDGPVLTGDMGADDRGA